MAEQMHMTLAQAKKVLPKGRYVHTFLNGGGMLIGADWSKKNLLVAMAVAPKILITGEQAQAMKHGLAILHDKKFVFIETVARTDGVPANV